ncbi:MAG: radical SAM protein [Nitrospiraceae bacterium]|nr:MAG: radical SAM protein [Nitrospiraceae bacterium]
MDSAMANTNSLDFLVQWHLTEKCNLKCTHCYQTGEHRRELSPSEVMKAIQEISHTLNSWHENYDIDFSPSLNITGGEPLLRKDIFEILGEFHTIGFDTYLLTNGTLVDDRTVDTLCGVGVKGVQVSIEGPEEIHDSIRGKKSFQRSLQGVKHMVSAGLEVTLNVTVSAINASHLINTVDIASQLGVSRLGFSRLVPSGKGKALLPEMLSAAEVHELYKKLFALKPDDGLEIVTGDPVASQFRNSLQDMDFGNIPLGGCAAGVSGLTILPDGTVVPCRRLPIPLGNVREDSLREIWAMSPVLNELRDKDKYQGKCGSCQNWANCRGCRAIAYAYAESSGKGDYLATDPQCFIGSCA